MNAGFLPQIKTKALIMRDSSYGSFRNIAITSALFFAILLNNISYPLSFGQGFWSALYFVSFGSMYTIAIWLLMPRSFVALCTAISGAIVILGGNGSVILGTEESNLIVIICTLVYHTCAVVALTRYSFRAGHVTTDVLIAATCLYLTIGTAYASIYTLVELVVPGSYISVTGEALNWPTFLYYSYVTLTTVGYGDIIPTTYSAQAFAAFEAVVGVLFTVILMARLVSGYSGLTRSKP